MKKRTFMIIFIVTQLILVFVHIDKQSRLIKLSYQKQHSERIIATLKAKKQTLVATLHGLQNHQKIKQFAEHELGMTTLSLKAIKKITNKELIHREVLSVKEQNNHEQTT